MSKLKLKLPDNLGDVLTKDEMKKVVGGYGSYDDGSGGYGSDLLGSQDSGSSCRDTCTWDGYSCKLSYGCPGWSCMHMKYTYYKGSQPMDKHICTAIPPAVKPVPLG